MGFSKISELRDLLASIPPGVITSAQRLILHTINGYTDDNDPEGACWIGYDRMTKEIGKSPRGLFDDLKGLKALGLVKTQFKFSRQGKRQKYALKWERLRDLASVNSDSYLKLPSMYSTDLEGELSRKGVGTQLPTYRDNKNNKQLENRLLISKIQKMMSYPKQVKVRDVITIDQLISVYLKVGGNENGLIGLFEAVKWDEINYPQLFIESELRKAINVLKPDSS
jgi:hypothetical protein